MTHHSDTDREYGGPDRHHLASPRFEPKPGLPAG